MKEILQALPGTFNSLKREMGLSPGRLSRYLKWMTKLHAVKKIGPFYVDSTPPVKKKDAWILGADIIRNRRQFKITHPGIKYIKPPLGQYEKDHEMHISLSSLDGYVCRLSSHQREEEYGKAFISQAKKTQILSPSPKSMLNSFFRGEWQFKDGKVVYEQPPHQDCMNQPCLGRVRRVGLWDIACEKCGLKLHLQELSDPLHAP